MPKDIIEREIRTREPFFAAVLKSISQRSCAAVGGAEWFAPIEAAGATAPAIFGQTLAGPTNGHKPIMPASLRHYDLHVWRWKDNPRGMFSPTNAKFKCGPEATYTVASGAGHH